VIRGQRVRIRPIERVDLPFMRALNDDPGVRGNVVGWGWPTSLAEQEAWFDRGGDSRTQRWVVEDADGQPVGITGLWDIDWHDRNALTALKLGSREGVRGQGLGTDAIKAVMAFAFYDAGLERLYSTILADNLASQRAYCGKSGWVVEGRARGHVRRHGHAVDLLHVGALRSDFEALPDAGTYRELVTGR
jgi:RimJ/RimL family protein N-acetyltransferase